MSINEEVELLRAVPLFAKVEPAKLKLLAFTSERLTFDPGQELCHQGDMGDAMYVILGGSADVLIDSSGGQIKVAELKKNGFVGEIAILCDVPRTATVVAHDRLTTLKITKETFFRMVTEFPTMAVEMMRELAHRLEDTNQKLRAVSAKAA
ncbi:MAG: cyclic nucleotide-binding domain-containing protein [Rhodospirillales bacterium]|nr:cyclic nucleotide-binding domain-containing protein [Rhodospirillales bacterium]QQS14767.1 MAG: cyclic nucleotide-binding domain-containing protein [Rhodospirillales bacterium]